MLYSVRKTQRLADAIAAAAPLLGPATGLAYARQAAWFEAVDDKGQRAGIKNHTPYEYRLFSKKGELRWLCGLTSDEGRAVFVSEDEGIVSKFAAKEPRADKEPPLEVTKLEPAESEYILWGRVCGDAQSGWVEAAEGRIGRFEVPVDAKAGERLALRFVEFVTFDDEHRNARVAEELLLGIRAIDE